VANKPVLKDHIIQKCGLSSPSVRTYLTKLLEAGLLDAYPAINLKHTPGRKTHRRMIYQTSKKGKDFLKQYNDLLTLLEISVKYTKMYEQWYGEPMCQKP